MKKIILILLFLLILFPLVSSVTCPTGQINDTYPGDCGIYTDQNKDNICDYSQTPSTTTGNSLSSLSDAELKDLISGTEMKMKTINQVAEIYKIESNLLAKELSDQLKVKINPTDSVQLIHDNYGIGPEAIKTVIIGIIKNNEIESIEKEGSHTYYITWITIIAILFYLASYILSKRGRFSQITHKKIWNFLLLVSFIISALTAVLYLLRIEYGFILNIPFNISYWHIEIGYIFILISIFHILWHIPYLKSYFKFNKKESSN